MTPKAILGGAWISSDVVKHLFPVWQSASAGFKQTQVPPVQVIIQLRKFAQAAKRIKDAVGTEASAPQLAKAVTKGEVKPGDLSDILGTEIRDGMDTSAFGEHVAEAFAALYSSLSLPVWVWIC